MSHFTVLVIGNDPEEQLAPYQENNMGDCPKELMEFHDLEDEYADEWENGTREMIVMEDGTLKSPYDHCFSEGTGFNKEQVIPDHLERREVPFKEVYEDFETYMRDWHGCQKRDEEIGKFGYWENPNAKWDWYQLGGRWNGFFKLKSPNMEGTVGEPGVFGNEPKHDADQCYKGQVDWDGMMDAAGEEARERYEKVESLFGGSIPQLEINWKKDMWDGGKYADLDIEEKRKIYHEQPALKQYEAMKKKIWDDKDNPDRDFVIWLELADYQLSKEEYIEQARNQAITTFAVVKDGNWYERGSMGWWACVSNEKDKGEWCNRVATLINDQTDDTLLSVFDCHI